MFVSELNYENAIIELFCNDLGYNYIYGPDIKDQTQSLSKSGRDYSNPLVLSNLIKSLERINPELPKVAVTEVISKLLYIDGQSLLQQNKQFMDYLQNGVTASFVDNNGELRWSHVQLVDYANIENNDFTIVNQWTVVGKSQKRADVVVFLNGLPVVVFELKSPSREETDVSDAFSQLKKYMREIPSLFVFNCFCVMSDLAMTKVGTITSTEDRFMEWRSVDGSYENTKFAQFDTLIEGMFAKNRFLDIIKNFICFMDDNKFITAYHQYFAVRKAVNTTLDAKNGKGGVFWHTQGSGKSLSMVFYVHLLLGVSPSTTFLVVTNILDLDQQLFEYFAKCENFLRQKPKHVESRSDLKSILSGQNAAGIFFTTQQKFESGFGELSTRGDIVVVADEAHRGHFLSQRVDNSSGRLTQSLGLIIRKSLPRAIFIGFTGTPISQKDRSTVEVFGDYIDVYDMTQAVDDGATVPVYYESRVIRLKLDNKTLRLLDEEYDLLAAEADGDDINRSKKELGRLESILGADQTINSLAEDIINHYEGNRQFVLTGKAMIVAFSRAIAMKIYLKILEIRPEWCEKVDLIMTEGDNDPEDWTNVVGNKSSRLQKRQRFADDGDPLKIVIVVNMLLAGFDLPSLSTMYFYRQMSGANLMQAIARVNRVFKGKAGGLIVDYVGLASALKKAMSDYSRRDINNFGEMDVAKTALPKFVEKLEVCRNLMHGFDYSLFLSETATDLSRLKTIRDGANFLSEICTPHHGGIVPEPPVPSFNAGQEQPPSRGELFIKEAALLRQALSLCSSLISDSQRLEATFFEAVRTTLTRFASAGKPLSLEEINNRINELLKEAVKSDGVVNLFPEADSCNAFSLFDIKFINEIANMPERNLSIQILKKLLAEQISRYRRINLVKSEKFSELLAQAMNQYLNGMITNEDVIKRLVEMARALVLSKAEGERLGLSEEEQAFFDALVKPEAIKDFYSNESLVNLTRELTEMLRKNRSIDWQKKESARAHMRRMVRKLLKKHKYPPEGMDEATKTVIEQCELFVDNY
jgi:type I restriction enzyme R subunit